MKTKSQTIRRHGAEHDAHDNPLQIKQIKGDELERFNDLAGQYHYMGEGHSSGHTMRFVATLDDEWIALFLWSSASYCLKPRDEYIGWSAPQRAQRLKLVVQNRRFVMLSKPGESKIPATKILGKMLRELPAYWSDCYGYEPLIAETFCDIEARAGTCYKASNWIPLGKTKGYSRHQADFYIPNDRPKKLWIFELRKDATAQLRSEELPPECRDGGRSDDAGVMPLNMKKIESLHELFSHFKDPRARNSIYSIGAMLSIITMAILSGHRNVVQIARFAERMKMPHRKALALPRFAKGSKYHKHPSYNAFYNLLKKLDVDLLAQTLSGWLLEHAGSLPVSLAMDGKFIRDTVGLVCLCDHETGIPQGMIIASQKKGDGDKCEMKASQTLISQMPSLENKEITADALSCQKRTGQLIYEKGGEFTIQIKDNQPTVLKNADLKTEHLSPFLNRQKKRMVELMVAL